MYMWPNHSDMVDETNTEAAEESLFDNAAETDALFTDRIVFADGSQLVGADPFEPIDASAVPDDHDPLRPVRASRAVSRW